MIFYAEFNGDFHDLSFSDIWPGALDISLQANRVTSRVGHIRRFVHVAPKLTYSGPMSSWITKFSKLILGNHLRHGLKVL